MFDGSSIAGWKSIEASDMKLMPDTESVYMDPFYAEKTLAVHCSIVEPDTGEAYERDPRSTAQKAEAYLKSSGIGDVAYFGPEAEFFIFDDIRFESTRFGSFYEIDSIEGNWNTGRDEGPNLGYKPRHKEGYFPVPPMDKFQDLRSKMVLTLEELGIEEGFVQEPSQSDDWLPDFTRSNPFPKGQAVPIWHYESGYLE